MDFLQQEWQDEYVFDEFEYEDDVFYRELRKQVLQLTEEEEEEEFYENKNSDMMAAKQGLNNGTCCVTQERVYYNWPKDKENDLKAPTWLLNLWRKGKGTGVFIPQIDPSQIKNRPRRKKGKKGRTQEGTENMI